MPVSQAQSLGTGRGLGGEKCKVLVFSEQVLHSSPPVPMRTQQPSLLVSGLSALSVKAHLPQLLPQDWRSQVSHPTILLWRRISKRSVWMLSERVNSKCSEALSCFPFFPSFSNLQKQGPIRARKRGSKSGRGFLETGLP